MNVGENKDDLKKSVQFCFAPNPDCIDLNGDEIKYTINTIPVSNTIP